MNKSKVEKLKCVNDNDILFRVKNGEEKLRKKCTKDELGCLHETYFLGNTPLIMVNSEKSPTCSALIKLADGREKVNEEILNKLKDINYSSDIEDSFEKVKSILELLEDGYYILKEVEMIPTDGEGNYFWNVKQVSRYYNAGADIFYNGKYIEGSAKFLAPSQGTYVYNEERVSYYRDKIKKGETLVGLAVGLRGFMSLLIDGHHKATAAYLEGQTIKCITILKYSAKDKESGEFPIYNNIVKKEFIMTNKIKRNIRLDRSKTVFPSFKAIALSNLVMDTSKGRIESLLKYNGKHPLEELKCIFYYLTIYNEEEAKKLSFNILYRNGFQLLWSMCLEYLYQYKDDEVKNLFLGILQNKNNYNCINYEKNKRIVDSYIDININ